MQPWCPAQLTGAAVTPFNVRRQNALLSEMARVLPRLAIGLGPDETRITAVHDDATTQTATVTIMTASDGNPQLFAEACHGVYVRIIERSALRVQPALHASTHLASL